MKAFAIDDRNGPRWVSSSARWLGGPGGWWLLDEPELHLGDDVLVPDLGGWRRQRMPRLPDGAALTLAPDWTCEVISPSTARVDRAQKLPIYAREHVEWLWLVDPLARTLEIFRLENDAWKLATVKGPTGLLHGPPFEAVAIDVARWWPNSAGEE
jgi:Uma2 family endonuclease